MDEQILAHRRAWADACDTYPQTHGRLRKSEGFCCLGVAEDIRLKSLGIEDGWKTTSDGDGKCFGIGTTAPETAVLTPAGSEWLGYDANANDEGCTKSKLLELFPELIDHLSMRGFADFSIISFVEMNDDLNLTLPQIAQVIRAYHLG